jgi:hypothetical protein
MTHVFTRIVPPLRKLRFIRPNQRTHDDGTNDRTRVAHGRPGRAILPSAPDVAYAKSAGFSDAPRSIFRSHSSTLLVNA